MSCVTLGKSLHLSELQARSFINGKDLIKYSSWLRPLRKSAFHLSIEDFCFKVCQPSQHNTLGNSWNIQIGQKNWIYLLSGSRLLAVTSKKSIQLTLWRLHNQSKFPFDVSHLSKAGPLSKLSNTSPYSGRHFLAILISSHIDPNGGALILSFIPAGLLPDHWWIIGPPFTGHW